MSLVAENRPLIEQLHLPEHNAFEWDARTPSSERAGRRRQSNESEVRHAIPRSEQANHQPQARNLYIFMDHHPNLFANAAYTTVLTNAIMWLATKPAARRP
jgi:hypothetical protein